jgi:hypothetical protein
MRRGAPGAANRPNRLREPWRHLGFQRASSWWSPVRSDRMSAGDSSGRARRFALLVFVMLTVVQAAWILAVPPFRGADEFDHVYRAAGVASGQWRLTERAADGRGLVVEVPGRLVEAASAQCTSLRYTGPDNCVPIEATADGRVSIATAAGVYPPLYYAVVGYPTEAFDGAGRDYALRVLSALLCGVGVAVAAWMLGIARAGPWARFGFVASITPVFVYTSVLPAPNSLEIVAGLCVWTGLLALSRRGSHGPTGLALLAFVTVGACVLGGLRVLGPLWLLLAVVVGASYCGWRTVWDAVRSRPAVSAAGALVVGVCTAGLLGWLAKAGTIEPTTVAADQAGVSEWSGRVVAWTFQLVAAFPFRNQPAPLGVYLLYFSVVLVMLALALRRAPARRRLVLLAAVLMTVALPVCITAVTVDANGAIWQGRYFLPFVVGILILAGTAIDDGLHPPAGWLRASGVLLLAVSHGWSVASVAADETQRAATHLGPEWVTLPPIALGTLVLVAWALLTSAAVREPRTQQRTIDA